MAHFQAEALAMDQTKPPLWFGAAALGHIREYIPTIVTEFAVLITQILVYKLAAHYLGKDGFSEYAVVRRAATFLAPLPLLGLAVGLPRYVAISRCGDERGTEAQYFGAALVCVLAAIALCLGVLNAAAHPFSFLLFGGSQYARLIFPLSLMLFGLSLHALVYSYFRGRLSMRSANILQLVNYASVPLAVFLFVGTNAERVLLYLGLFWTLVACVALCFTPVTSVVSFKLDHLRELLRYGIQRVPGDFILMALLSLPVIFVAHNAGMTTAGFVAIGISVLSMIGALVTPIGLILLPKASTLLATGKKAELKAHVVHIAVLSLVVSGAASLIIWIFAHLLIQLYLGPGFDLAASFLQLIVLGAVPYALFALLRNLVDAFHHNAVTALITAISFVVFIAGVGIGHLHPLGGREVLIALVVSLFFLGAATGWECIRILRC
jgi:O-antigen/teichoic acid export membrane protein